MRRDFPFYHRYVINSFVEKNTFATCHCHTWTCAYYNKCTLPPARKFFLECWRPERWPLFDNAKYTDGFICREFREEDEYGEDKFQRVLADFDLRISFITHWWDKENKEVEL